MQRRLSCVRHSRNFRARLRSARAFSVIRLLTRLRPNRYKTAVVTGHLEAKQNRSSGRPSHLKSPFGGIVSITSALKRSAVALAATTLVAAASPAFAWEPTKPVEFVVPAGTGGGADQMARLLQGVISKNNLMKEPLIVVNKSGGAGAEGFLDVKNSKGDPHKIIITLSNLFTTPLATGVPFNWKDLTPVAMLALDQFVLWVNADTPYKTAGEYVAAVKAAGPNKFKMGGTGSKQEDQIITVGLEKATGTKFIYVPFKGGGEVAVQLVGNHVD